MGRASPVTYDQNTRTRKSGILEFRCSWLPDQSIGLKPLMSGYPVLDLTVLGQMDALRKLWSMHLQKQQESSENTAVPQTEGGLVEISSLSLHVRVDHGPEESIMT